MTAKLTLCTGPAASGKTSQLLGRYCQSLRSLPAGSLLWLAPNYRTADQVRSRLLSREMTACFSPGVMTFDQFAESVLRFAQSPIRPLTRLMKRQLLTIVLSRGQEKGEIQYFAPIAEAPGLIDRLESFVTELKGREIWPEHLAEALSGKLSPRQRELCWLYAEYQRLLHEHQLYDAQGRFWSARALLREGQTRPFERLRMVVADGFTDITITQLEILEILSERVDEILISLPLEEDRQREFLFQKPAHTLRQLQKINPKLRRQLFQPLDALPADLRQMETEIFKAPSQQSPLRSGGSISLVRTAGQLRELEWIARRVKELLIAGDGQPGSIPVKPDEIAVVFRSLGGDASLIREVFTSYGLPFVVDDALSLEELPCLRALVLFLRLEAEDWPYRQVLAAIGNSYYRPSLAGTAREEALAAAERIVREVQVPRGRDELLARLRRLAHRPPDDMPPENDDVLGWSWSRQRRSDDARRALPILQELADRLALLPKQGTPRDWAGALVQLAGRLGWQTALEQQRDQLGLAGFERLQDALDQHESLASKLTGHAPVLSRTEILRLVLDILKHERITEPVDPTARVRISSAAGARNLRVPYLFFAGLTEGAFPQRRDESFLMPADLDQLRAAGRGLPSTELRDSEEMLLFYEVITRADRRLYLSYPALDPKAEPLLPSPFLTEIEQLCPAGVLNILDETDPRPVIQGQTSWCAAEARVAAIHQSLDSKPELLAQIVGHWPLLGNNLLDGLKLTDARSGPLFGRYEGLLSNAAAVAHLQKHFGPNRRWSVSLLEQYATCPFQFFTEQVLRVAPLEDMALEINAAERGRWLHEILARLHRRLNDHRSGPAPLGGESDELIQSYFQQALEELRAEHDDQAPLDAALRDITSQILTRWGSLYAQQHRDYESQFDALDSLPLPTYFEVSFGLPDGGKAKDLKTDQPLVLSRGSDSIAVWGRIDRVDLARHGGQLIFNVIDYKTGRVPSTRKDAPIDGTSLQLDLYALALQRVLLKGQALPARGGYWGVKEAGFKSAIDMCDLSGERAEPLEKWLARAEEVITRVFELVAGIRRGEFPVFSRDSQCTGYCSYRTACRVNSIRALDKQWPPLPVTTR